ncbi:hypothetical protein LTR99_007655 [Exophiala xenobiotica]|uniref:DUF1989 domain-containing protein n=1 Tax=Vermiconidia calcicola TaxID=1690605 RepID=A0AAV9Q7E6_9PEZI|nr:hypothetical protein LTR96_000375 [Exophiala xenobiotica]KAK5535374.1 hypothetical protein LTR25_006382 [Vermiconidia calcicola]KAK5546875.1 hypothetical protein LTR23_003246 [Chaetothyriales sp. CCFEE 6169]KAK5297966.1 hypothetical protein LTR99_007655 [Exophiala xenobiotica]KAK5338007.1 hypothetical protein LTR98_005856 [Exophiala xenobiotica]
MAIVTIPAQTGDYVALKSGQRLKLINPHGNQVIDFWAFVFPSNTSTASDGDGDIVPPRSFIRSSSSSTTTSTSATTTTTTPYPFATGIQYFSASRTRSILSKLIPATRDVLYTNKSLPLFTLVEDTTSGIHDTLFGCCDRFRMHNLGHPDYEHASCSENMHVALARAAAANDDDDSNNNKLFAPGSMRVSDEWTPDPLNVFMNVPITTGLDRNSGGGRIECRPPQSKRGEYIVLRAERDCLAVMSACPNDLIKGVNAGECVGVEYEVLA